MQTLEWFWNSWGRSARTCSHIAISSHSCTGRWGRWRASSRSFWIAPIVGALSCRRLISLGGTASPFCKVPHTVISRYIRKVKVGLKRESELSLGMWIIIVLCQAHFYPKTSKWKKRPLSFDNTLDDKFLILWVWMSFVQRLSRSWRFPIMQEDLFVARAPGRLDVMGGIADYSGSVVLQVVFVCSLLKHISSILFRQELAIELRPTYGIASPLRSRPVCGGYASIDRKCDILSTSLWCFSKFVDFIAPSCHLIAKNNALKWFFFLAVIL